MKITKKITAKNIEPAQAAALALAWAGVAAEQVLESTDAAVWPPLVKAGLLVREPSLDDAVPLAVTQEGAAMVKELVEEIPGNG